MKKFVLASITASFCLLGLANSFVAGAAPLATETLSDTDIVSYPLYASLVNQPPLIMLLLGRDHSMYYEAYNDMTDLDEDGAIDGMYTPHVVYDGIFESNWCYVYDKDNTKMFYMSSLASATETYNGNPVYKCSGKWSGNFLNYVTSTRMDIVKRILIGGQRFANFSQCKNETSISKNKNKNNLIHNTCRDGDNYPVLARQFVPRDTHGWAKSYNKYDMDARCEGKYSCSLSDWAPVGAENAMFGSVGRQLYVVTDDAILNGTKLNFGSYDKLAAGEQSDNDSVFVWNWVARESGAFGADSQGTVPKGVLAFYDGKTAFNKPKVTSNTGHFTVKASSYNVLVQACKYGDKPKPSRCKKYDGNVYNTVGLLQDFSKPHAIEAYFGLITSIWNTDYNNNNNMDAKKRAALRAPISDLSSSSQINQENGDFMPDSVYVLINNLSLSINEKSPKSTAGGSTGSNGAESNWNDCKIVSSNDKTIAARGCSDWGNPLVPLIQKSYSYFKDDGRFGDSTSDQLVVKRFTDDPDGINFSYKRVGAVSPYKDENLKLDYCNRPINFILADESVSMDYDTSASVASADVSNIKEGFEIISKKEGASFTGKHIFGEYSGSKKMRDSETIHSLKPVSSGDNSDTATTNLMEVRGVSTLEPNVQGSLKGAALAAYLHNNPLNFEFSTEKGKERKNVLDFEHISVAMASYLPQFEVYANNGRKVLIVPTCKSPKRTVQGTIKPDVGKIGSFDYDPEESYTSNCAIADVFYVSSKFSPVKSPDGKGTVNRLTSLEFRVTYEDNEAGSDFDMDALFTYKIQAEGENLINVSITGFYSDTFAGQVAGYSIFGTSGVIAPDYSTCNNGKCNITNDTRYVVDADRTYFLDMMKVDQNAKDKNFNLMRSFSDPYNEFNNLGIEIDGDLNYGNLVNSGSRVEVVSGDAQAGETHRYTCLSSDNVKAIKEHIYYYSNYLLKFLPSFSANCQATVHRKFYVVGVSNEKGFYDSPLDYAAYYGSSYGDNGGYTDRKKNNPNFFYVTNASKLASQITAALTKAVGSGKSGTGMTFPSLDVTNTNAAITATYDTAYWTGQLHRHKLKYNSDGSIDVEESGTQGSSPVSWPNGGVLFDSNSKVLIADKAGVLHDLTFELLVDDASEYPLTDAILNHFSMDTCSKENREQLIQHYVDYVVKGDAEWEIKGDESKFTEIDGDEKISCGSQKFYGFHPRGTDSGEKVKRRKLGAIISSTPKYYTVGGKRKVIFAANDGMVHVVNQSDGHVDFSIIPYVSQSLMPKFAVIKNQDHLINDGKITVRSYGVCDNDECKNPTEHLIAIGTLGVVYPGMYAIDLTNSATTNPKMIWELSPNYATSVDSVVKNVPNLGAIHSDVTVAAYQLKDDSSPDSKITRLYAIFGNGYNSASGLAGVVVLDAQNGDILSSENADDNATDGSMLINTYGWSSPNCNRNADAYVDFKDPSGLCYKNGMNEVIAFDSNSDSILDYIYATDLYGNVYRIRAYTDGANQPVKYWRLSHIHTTVTPKADGKVKVQPITTAPQIGMDASGDPMVIVGTGRYLGKSDLTTGDIQSIWGLSDNMFTSGSDSSSDATALLCGSNPLDMTCYRDGGYSGKSLFVKTLKPATLQDANGQDLYGYRDFAPRADGLNYDLQYHVGWVIDLDTVNRFGISERIKNNMKVVDKHLYVTTLTPSASTCEGGGTSNSYDFNIISSNFYLSAVESQSYSDTIYNEMTLAFTRSTSDSGEGGEGGDEPCTGPECTSTTDVRDRVNTEYGCSTVIKSLTKVDGGATAEAGPQYCPRVESWQFIYN